MPHQTFHWNEEKNQILKQNRNISFEEIVTAISKGNLLEIISNSSQNHKNQKCLVVRVNDYAHIVPYAEEEGGVFLKTIYPSRKYKKLITNSSKTKN